MKQALVVIVLIACVAPLPVAHADRRSHGYSFALSIACEKCWVTMIFTEQSEGHVAWTVRHHTKDGESTENSGVTTALGV